MQVSSHWRHGQPISIDFFPSMESGWLIACKRARPRGTMRSVLVAHLPARLVGSLAERLGLDGALATTSVRNLVAANRRTAGRSFFSHAPSGFHNTVVIAAGTPTHAHPPPTN